MKMIFLSAQWLEGLLPQVEVALSLLMLRDGSESQQRLLEVVLDLA
jgi:hypothetical protein